MQERARAQVKLKFDRIAAREGLNPYLIKGFDGRFRLTDRGTEGCEIMLADQMACGFLHGGKIKGLLDGPCLPQIKGQGRAAVDQPIGIAPFNCGKPRVPIL